MFIIIPAAQCLDLDLNQFFLYACRIPPRSRCTKPQPQRLWSLSLRHQQRRWHQQQGRGRLRCTGKAHPRHLRGQLLQRAVA